jgi:transcriptional regulator GlxA family with amidase domain
MYDRHDLVPATPPERDGVLDVTVLLLGGGLSSTAIVPVEIFDAAGQLWNDLQDRPAEPAFRVTTATVDGRPVRTATGFSIAPEASIEQIERTDIVIIPTPGLELDVALVENSVVLPWLRRLYEGGAYVAGVCAGAAFVAEAGLLDGRIGTTHWAIARDFATRWRRVNWRTDLFVTEDHRVLCSGGLYASMDLSLYLVEKFCGHEVALQCAKALLLPMPRKLQTGYATLPLSPPHGDDRIRAIEIYLQSAYREPISTEALARRAGLGARTFLRHFKAATGRHPGAYIQALRIETAKAMLERDTAPIQQVSSAVGYDDVAFFRTLFKRATGMTPAEYRSHFAPLATHDAAEVPPIGVPRLAAA